MPPRPVPADLLFWARDALSLPEAQKPGFELVAGDASPRRYYRLSTQAASYIVAEAPPATEKNHEFVAIRARLENGGVRVPALHAVDMERGYLLLEDLGDRMLLPELADATVAHYYEQAFGLLQHMAAIDTGDMPAYNRALLTEELSRFDQWFLRSLMHYEPSALEEECGERLFAVLIDSALAQPQCLVHRDFHSRNLMLLADESLAVIDFQDAVVGPATYDLVSLLRDCYIRWDEARVRQWALMYRDRSVPLQAVPELQFLRWFDLMGLQRHIKVLGTFARLYLRDDKPAYLDDLPLVIHYVREILQRYREETAVADFAQWFDDTLMPQIRQQAWWRAQ